MDAMTTPNGSETSNKYMSQKTLVVIGSVLLYCAFPPLSVWPLILLGVACFLPTVKDDRTYTRRDYLHLWLWSSLTWLALLQGVRLAFWPLYAGWLALAIYLGCYLPLTILTARSLYHRYRWPLSLAFGFSWLSWDLVRSYFATGFGGCMLGHAVVSEPWLIQIAAHLGPYGVTLQILAAACFIFQLGAFQSDLRAGLTTFRRRILECGLLLVVVIGCLVYGRMSLQQADQFAKDRSPLLTVALIQENAPTIFESNPDRNVRSFSSYVEATRAAVQKHASNSNSVEAKSRASDVDLIVWPESVFTANESIFEWDGKDNLPKELVNQNVDFDRMKSIVGYMSETFDSKVNLVQRGTAPNGRSSDFVAPYLLVGNDVVKIQDAKMDRYNAAVFVGRDGKQIDYYAKRHLVMFGEYIPIANWLPILYDVIGMAPASAGERALSLELKTNDDRRVLLAPSICFENMLPQIIGGHVRSLLSENKSPDVLINITNDGWFRGSSILDIHLANATMTAVENRRPMLVAANTGLSAWIDGSGRRISVTKRLSSDSIVAQPTLDSRWGLWQTLGDWPIRILAIVCLGIPLSNFARMYFRKK